MTAIKKLLCLLLTLAMLAGMTNALATEGDGAVSSESVSAEDGAAAEGGETDDTEAENSTEEAAAVEAGAAEASIPTVSQGQLNIVKRARQLTELKWTPLVDRYQWGYYGVFYSGTTYTGAPYGQPVHTGYIGYAVTIDEFISAVEDSTSSFYSGYSSYNKIAPYYSIDCSGFVSYAWGLKLRKDTRTLPAVSEKLEDQSINAIEVGDCLNNVSSHVVLVSDVKHDAEGNVVAIEIMEQTPVITRTTLYGEGGKRALAYFQNYYLDGGYAIYRYPGRDDVTYTHSCAVPIDGDECDNCKAAAPYVSATASYGSKTVAISHSDATKIYYTLDGSMPTTSSSVYSGQLTVNDTTTVKAAALMPDGSLSRVVTYRAEIGTAATPTYSITAGMSNGTEVSSGSTVSLKCGTAGAVIYYTTDGTAPDKNSAVYSTPLKITEDTTIRAYARCVGSKDSAEARFDFTIGTFVSYSDVLPEAWYYEAVEYVSTMGLFNGTDAGVFSPDTAMTRGMFITVLARLAGGAADLQGTVGVSSGDDVNVRTGAGTSYGIITTVNKNAAFSILGKENGWYKVSLNGREGYIIEKYVKAYEGYFTDLDESRYYSPYVQWAYLVGITSGAGNGAFSAEGSVTREDMAALLYNYTKAFGVSLKTPNAATVFSDDGSIASAKKEAVYALQRSGVINGMGDGSFSPLSGATRAQVAQIFMNFKYAEN